MRKIFLAKTNKSFKISSKRKKSCLKKKRENDKDTHRYRQHDFKNRTKGKTKFAFSFQFWAFIPNWTGTRFSIEPVEQASPVQFLKPIKQGAWGWWMRKLLFLNSNVRKGDGLVDIFGPQSPSFNYFFSHSLSRVTSE